MQTEHFDLYFYPEERAGADISARLAERWYARLSRIFAHTIEGRQPLVLYASQTQFSQTNVIQDELSEGTGGVTEPLGFVSDTANFGGTSPVQGERYRLEAAPTFGHINFTSLLADYRRYFMPKSFYTIAVRAMHIGRYGSGAEDSRLSPLFLGYPTLVRGYDLGSFSARDCVPNASSSCPALDRLLGSRLMIGNLEFRFPLLRPFEVSRQMYGPLPIELAFFADGGMAWNSGERPAIFGGARDGVSSSGVTLRLNLGGYAIGQFDVVRPLQRSGQGWIVQFNLTPGF